MLGGDASLGERVALGRWAGDDEDRLAIVARIACTDAGWPRPLSASSRYDDPVSRTTRYVGLALIV